MLRTNPLCYNIGRELALITARFRNCFLQYGTSLFYIQNMKTIPLSNNGEQKALVSDEDFDRVKSHRWVYHNMGYAMALIDGKRTLMHRYILQAPRDRFVDHIDHNGLNNTRSNIRLCTPMENQRNRRTGKNNTSGYKGVWVENGRWRSALRVNKKRMYLGSFDTKEDAARAYDDAVIKFHGAFALPNTSVVNV